MRQSARKRTNDGIQAPLTVSGLRIYRRLLAYAQPYWAMFLLGVVGMVLFAAVDTGLAWLVKQFLDGAFVERDSRVLLMVPVGIVVLFTGSVGGHELGGADALLSKGIHPDEMIARVAALITARRA